MVVNIVVTMVNRKDDEDIANQLNCVQIRDCADQNAYCRRMLNTLAWRVLSLPMT